MTGLRSGGRKLSFDVLTTTDSFFDDDGAFLQRSTSGPPEEPSTPNTKRRKRKNKKKNKPFDFNYQTQTTTITTTEVVYAEVAEESVGTVISSDRNSPELRQRSTKMFIDEDVKECIGSSCVSNACATEMDPQLNLNLNLNLNSNGNADGVVKNPLDFVEQESNDKKTLPIKYYIEEMFGGNSLRTTTSLADEKERERVYDTIFSLPWRCELLIDVGFFVCLDSFLSVLTIMPMRILTTFWRILKTRQFKISSPAELSDLGCCVIMACGVMLLQQTDISLIYHMIRGQGTIKLYVVYNVLEIFDRLCQNFGGDVLQTLFNSAHGLANCPSECKRYWIWRFISDEALAILSSIVHSFILLAQAITLSTCMVAHNNALFALLVSNNFTEIKSNVFKRFSKDNIQQLVYFDSIERFHISAFLIFILAQNILEDEGAWFETFLYNALVVHICEMIVDIVKHSFIAKFNEIKPIVYSEFLEDLCKQTLNIETGNGRKNLTFVPLAPACVVIRALSPIYAAHLPSGPMVWRVVWILILMVMTFVMLTSFKVMIGIALHKHSTWHIKRCQGKKLHSD